MGLIKSNIHRKKIADRLRGEILNLSKYEYFQLGEGGKINGVLVSSNGNTSSLRAKVGLDRYIYEIIRINDYEYIYRLIINTNINTELVGKDITEMGLFDEDNDLCFIETFEGYGPLQSNHQYEFEFRIFIN